MKRILQGKKQQFFNFTVVFHCNQISCSSVPGQVSKGEFNVLSELTDHLLAKSTFHVLELIKYIPHSYFLKPLSNFLKQATDQSCIEIVSSV